MNFFTKISIAFIFISTLNYVNGQVKFDKIKVEAGSVYTFALMKGERNSSINEYFSGAPGLALETTIDISLSNRLQVGTGIKFLSSHYDYNIENIILGTDIINGTVTNLSSTNKSKYIGIPINFIYNLKNLTSLKTDFRLGINYYRNYRNRLIYSNSGTNIPTNTPDNLVLFEKNNYTTSAKLDFLFPFAEKYFLSANLGVEYFFKENTYSLFGDRKANLFTTQINLGFGYKI